ncbi:MAG: cytochrome c5 family protein [Halioglobus sp.]
MSRTRTLFKSLSLLVLLGVIAACAKEQSPEAALTESASRDMRPADEQIAKIYDRSCRNCHTIAATGAPLTGDAPEWSVRLEKGMSTMVDNVVSGVGGMPPFGMCMDCNLEEFEALIIFMAQVESDVSDNG